MGRTEGGKEGGEGGGGRGREQGDGGRGNKGREGEKEGGSKVMWEREQWEGWREGGRERVRGGREEARTLHRHEASVEEGRVEGGREG